MSPPPTRISRYEIKGLFAQGGMGDLYLARDPNTDRLVALKLLNATLDSSEIRGRFEREARALASLNHPNIVHIYDYGDFQGAPFIVMEYVRGETLAEKIKRHAPIPVSEKLRLMVELCAGLAHAHQAGIIHRDVKPANLLVDQDEHVKILDFGIARVVGSNLTTLGTMGTLNMQIGTPGYMSPEQIEGGDIDQRADVFAAGAVCYELLANRAAFSGGNSSEIEHQVIAGHPIPLASLMPDLDPELDAIVSRALAKHRHDRYPGAAQLGEALESYRSRKGRLARTPAPVRRPVAPPANAGGKSRGDAAFQRAVDSYEDGAHDAAKRFASEALAEDPDHAGAHALLGRLDAKRRLPAAPQIATPSDPSPPASTRPSPAPPTAVSEPTVFLPPNDATVLIPPADNDTDSIDQTVFIPPVKPPVRRTRDDETARMNGPDRSVKGAADATVLVKPAKPGRHFTPVWYAGLLAACRSLLARSGAGWKRRPASPHVRRPSRTRPTSPLWKQYGRGALIAAALVMMAAGAALLAIWLGVIGPSGHLLTITKPIGGTISSADIRCGTRGSDCVATHRGGGAVELTAEPDAGFAFSGFTGDCAPAGLTAMTGPRTCGATFERIVSALPPVEWPLTIKPPTGGTILAAGGIECGSMRGACTTYVPDGAQVTLIARADPDHTFLKFTDECAPTGNTIMTGPRTCGATFAAVGQQEPEPAPVEPIKRTPKPPPVVVELPSQQTPSASTAAPTREVPSTEQAPVTTGTPVKDPISREEHAKNEIQGLLKEYCAALEAMDPPRIRKIFPSTNVSMLHDQYRQYKSATCALTAPPEFVQLDADAGTAQVKVGVKQTQEMKSGGAPKIQETIASLTLLRPELRSTWRIETIRHELKPKE